MQSMFKLLKGRGCFTAGLFNFADKMSPLGNATSTACADYCIAMFSDLTKMVTMQNLFHDGGFSNTGISHDIMEKFSTGE